MKHEQQRPVLLSVANGLTFGRLCAVPLIIFLVANSQTRPLYVKLALFTVVVLQASDVLDGFLARRAQKQRKFPNLFGQIMDPAADKLYINSTCFTLSITQDFPWWITLTIFSKDVFIFLAWLVFVFLSGNTFVKPDVWGKAADSSQACMIFAFLLNIPKHVFLLCGLITLGLTIISGITLIIRDLPHCLTFFTVGDAVSRRREKARFF